MEHESDCYTKCNWYAQYYHQRSGTGTGVYGNKRIGTGTRGLGNKRIRRDHPNYSIVDIGQNTEKSPGDLRRLATSQTPVENYHLTLK